MLLVAGCGAHSVWAAQHGAELVRQLGGRLLELQPQVSFPGVLAADGQQQLWPKLGLVAQVLCCTVSARIYL